VAIELVAASRAPVEWAPIEWAPAECARIAAGRPERVRRPHSERGTVTAEFAIVLPAVLLVLAAALGALQIAGDQLRLQAVAVDAARMFARGDPAAASRVAGQLRGASVTRRTTGTLVCADARTTASIGVLPGIALHASSCALAESP
jgi:Flp pilus assembly protein TadG